MRLIDKEAIVKEIDWRMSFLIADEDGYHPIAIEVIRDFIKNLKTVEHVKHGTWVYADDWKDIGKVMDLLRKFDIDPLDADIESIYCSCCGKGFNVCDNQDTDEFEYCPHCGAKMDGEPE